MYTVKAAPGMVGIDTRKAHNTVAKNLRPKALLDKLTAAIEGSDVSAPSDNRKPVIVEDADGATFNLVDLVINDENNQIVLRIK